MRIALIIPGVALMLIGIVGYRLYYKKHRSVDKEEYFIIPAVKLFEDFETNEGNANTLYLDKVVEVKGTVADIEVNQDGAGVIVLKTNSASFGIRCTMKEKPDYLKTGAEATIKGICTGYLWDVVLTDGIIVDK